jgi:hypothetical protein
MRCDVMKTISERIEVVVDEIDANTLGLTRKGIREILQDHFSEPWLDAPDGPGWWFVDVGNEEPGVVHLQADAMELSQKSMFKKWQRAIGPS